MNNFLPADWRLGYNTAAPYGIYDSQFLFSIQQLFGKIQSA